MESGQVYLKMSDWPDIVYSGKADHFLITAEVINAFIRWLAESATVFILQ